jgi:hypothetical protein
MKKVRMLVVATCLSVGAVQATETVNVGGNEQMQGQVQGQQALGGSVGNVSGGETRMNSRAYGLGMGAAVSPATCYGSILGGAAVWENHRCVREQLFRQLQALNLGLAQFAFICQEDEQRQAIEEAANLAAAAGDRTSLRCPQRRGPDGPVFQTGAEGDQGYGSYFPHR